MTYFQKFIFGILAFAGALYLPGYAHAKAAEPINLLAHVTFVQQVSSEDRLDALAYVQEELQTVDPGCAAFDSLLGYQEDILAQEADPSAVREMAELYRARHKDEAFRAIFASYLAN